MLLVVEFLGWLLLWLLLGSKQNAALPSARNFTLAGGSLLLGFLLGLLLYWRGKPSWGLDRVDAFVLLPACIIVFTFVVEAIKKEIQKNAGQIT